MGNINLCLIKIQEMLVLVRDSNRLQALVGLALIVALIWGVPPVLAMI
jgi:hypothetical protein